MTKRKTLSAGLAVVPEGTDAAVVESFLRPAAVEEEKTSEPANLAVPKRRVPVGLIPVTVRLKPEIAGALKRASLERQLCGEAVHTQQDLVELVLAPWLRGEGYLE